MRSLISVLYFSVCVLILLTDLLKIFLTSIMNCFCRKGRVMKIPAATYYHIAQDRKDDDLESKIAGSKIVTNNNVNKKPMAGQVSETDLYLLSAIEKLVYKVDFMEKRLRRVEEMLYYNMAGNRIDTGKSEI